MSQQPLTTQVANIVLVGPMGSGKTTLGRHLAQLMQWDFVDCDEELERQTGASVNLIFDIEGEQGFRARESRMLVELVSGQRRVIATGGGVVLSEKNRRLLNQAGLVVWLKTSVQQQLHRLKQDRKRPLLQAPGREQRLEKMAKQRNPLYQQVADVTFPTSQRGLKTVAESLHQLIHEHLANTRQENQHAQH